MFGRSTLSLLVAAAFFCATPVVAHANFGSVFDVSAASDSSENPQVVADASGNDHVVWDSQVVAIGNPGYEVRYREILADGTRLDERTIASDGSDSAPQVGVDGAGNVIIVWTTKISSNDFKIRARRIGAGGALGPITDISNDEPQIGAPGPRLAVNAAGDAVIAWASTGSGKQMIKSRRWRADGSLGPVLDTSAASSIRLESNPHVAIAPNGDATVSWLETVNITQGAINDDDALRNQVQARRIRGDTLDPIQVVSGLMKVAVVDPDVFVDESGNASIIWRNVELGAPGEPTTAKIVGRRLTADGTLDSQFAVSPDDSAGLYDVTIDAQGRPIVAWEEQQSADVSQLGIWVRRVNADGTVSEPPLRVAVGDLSLTRYPHVASYGNGGAIVTFHTQSLQGAEVDAVRVNPSWQLGTGKQTVFVQDQGSQIIDARVAVGGSAPALVVWKADDGTVVQGAQEAPQAAPTCVDENVAVEFNQASTFPLFCEDGNLDLLRYIKVSDPAHGTLTIGTFGLATYTPAQWFSGPDGFSSKANDGLADSNPAQITIDVAAPPASEDQLVTTEETTSTSVVEQTTVRRCVVKRTRVRHKHKKRAKAVHAAKSKKRAKGCAKRHPKKHRAKKRRAKRHK